MDRGSDIKAIYFFSINAFMFPLCLAEFPVKTAMTPPSSGRQT